MIYLDNAATTKPYGEAIDVYDEYSRNDWFNPSALYPQSVDATAKLRSFREDVKRALCATPEDDLYFISGGTEGDNWALFGTKKAKNSRIIVSLGEHDAVVNPANELKAQGYDVCFAPINSDGSVNKEEFAKLLTKDVSLVSVMHVSNETGAVNDIAALVKMVRKNCPNAVFHSDGVQAFCKIPVNVRALGVDMYTISGHKIHAPKGIGALYVKNGTRLKPILFGGGQEKGMRSGTENLPLVASFAKAIELNKAYFDDNYSKKVQILEYIKQNLLENVPDLQVISPLNRAPHVLTVAFSDVRGEVLLHSVEKRGLLVGIGSACSSHHESRFKGLLGLDDAHKDGIIRFSASEFNTLDEAREAVNIIIEEEQILRNYVRK